MNPYAPLPDRNFSRAAKSLISSLRGFDDEELAAFDRGTTPLASVIELLIEKHHIGKQTLEERILQSWADIVGPAFAKRCRPERIDAAGTLILQAGNATLRRELIFIEDRILTAVASLPGGHRIRKVAMKSGTC